MAMRQGQNQGSSSRIISPWLSRVAGGEEARKGIELVEVEGIAGNEEGGEESGNDGVGSMSEEEKEEGAGGEGGKEEGRVEESEERG